MTDKLIGDSHKGIVSVLDVFLNWNTHSNVKYSSNVNILNWKKWIWGAWDSNPGPQNGRSRQNHGAIAATQFAETLSTYIVEN